VPNQNSKEKGTDFPFTHGNSQQLATIDAIQGSDLVGKTLTNKDPLDPLTKSYHVMKDLQSSSSAPNGVNLSNTFNPLSKGSMGVSQVLNLLVGMLGEHLGILEE
jgi:hypothetical protein